MYSRPVKFTTTGQYGCASSNEDDVYTVKEFLEFVEDGAFRDCDGYGYPVKDRLADESILFFPSNAKLRIPKDATHIIWFNS